MKNIITEIRTYLKKYPVASCFFHDIMNAANIYLIGGILREYDIEKKIENIRDIDTIIDIKDNEKWNQFLRDYQHKVNVFGGYKFVLDGIKFDIWKIEDTWAFKNNVINVTPDKYVENLQYTVFLSSDSIIYDVSNKKLYDELYVKSKRTKILDVILEENPYIELNILRAIIIKHKYNMNYSEKLRRIMMKEYNKNQELLIGRLLQIQHNRYNEILISEYELKKEFCNLIDEEGDI